MTIVGIVRITYGVANMEKARRFFTDWGLVKISNGKERALFPTANQSEVRLLPRGHKSLHRGVGRATEAPNVGFGR